MKYFNITGMAKKAILCQRSKKCPYRCGNTGRGEQPRNNERVKHIITGLLPFLQDERRYKAMNQNGFSLNIREELLQKLYDIVNNKDLCFEMQKALYDLDEFVTDILPGGDKDDRMDRCMELICYLEHAAFMAGANLALDFIAGREVW